MVVKGQVVDGQVLLVRDSPLPTEPELGPPGLGRLLDLARGLVGLAGGVRRAATPLARAVADAATSEPVTLRVGGERVEAEPAALAAAYPRAGGRLVVLVPAPGEGERVWERGVRQTGATYADRLEALLGWTPLTLRVSATAGLTDAGLALASLLQRVVAAWPVPVERIVLVAHGTGGLVARAALGFESAGGPDWRGLVTELFGLGTPRYAVPESAVTLPGRRLDEVLAGIVPDEPGLGDVRLPETLECLLVAEGVTRRAHPLGTVLGGLLWWRHRAPWRPRTARDLFPDGETLEVGITGAPLANHPEVHHALLSWLGR